METPASLLYDIFTGEMQWTTSLPIIPSWNEVLDAFTSSSSSSSIFELPFFFLGGTNFEIDSARGVLIGNLTAFY